MVIDFERAFGESLKWGGGLRIEFMLEFVPVVTPEPEPVAKEDLGVPAREDEGDCEEWRKGDECLGLDLEAAFEVGVKGRMSMRVRL